MRACVRARMCVCVCVCVYTYLSVYTCLLVCGCADVQNTDLSRFTVEIHLRSTYIATVIVTLGILASLFVCAVVSKPYLFLIKQLSKQQENF